MNCGSPSVYLGEPSLRLPGDTNAGDFEPKVGDFCSSILIEWNRRNISSRHHAIEESREPVGGLSFIGYRRTKTMIELPGANAAYSSRQILEVEPADLAAALARDVERGDAGEQV